MCRDTPGYLLQLDTRCQEDKPHLCTAQTEQQLPRVAEDPWLDHWHVYIHYCSSDTWAGTRAASQHTGGFTFHGRHILAAVLRSLAEHHGLLTASSVVLTGTSAGAQG